MKVFLINDTENEYHWGCYGTSSAIKKQLSAHGVNLIGTFSCSEASKIENSPRKCLLVYSKNPLVRRFSRFYFVNYFKKNLPDLYNGIATCDRVVINGEGTINSIHVATRFIFFIVYLAKEILNKKVCIINHSCYPKLSRASQLYYYKSTYAKCDFIAAREEVSAQTIQEKLHARVTLSFDSLPLAVQALSAVPESFYKDKYICLSGAVNYDIRSSSYIAEELLKNYPHHKIVYLIGSATGANNEEAAVINSLKPLLPQMIVHDAKTFEEWLSIIKHSSILISGRYHYSIAAMCFGTPMICFASNTPKIDAVNDQFGLPACVTNREQLIETLKTVHHFPWRPLLDEMCGLAKKNYHFIPSQSQH